MSADISDFKELYETTKKFYNNITRDPLERRENAQRVNKLLLDVGLLDTKYYKLIEDFKKVSSDEKVNKAVETYANEIQKIIANSRKIILDRLDKIGESSNNSDSNMTDKFDLKTAASLLPAMDGSEDSTKQLIDAIELYSELLDNNSHKLLINYVLKTRLSQSAKIRLEKTYATVNNLISDMKIHLLTKKSAAALATELHCVRQNGKTIDEYARNIEELFTNLTITQADGNDSSIPILRSVNEKIAINVFANGLKNSELRTVIKARNYTLLKDAIIGAKDEEKIKNFNPISTTFHMQTQNNTRGYRGRFNVNRSNNRGRDFNFQSNSNGRHYVNNNQRIFNNNHYRGQGRVASRGTSGRPFRSHSNFRGHRQNNYRGQQATYVTDVSNDFSECPNNTNLSTGSSNQKFFRP